MEIREEIHTPIELLYITPLVFDSSDKAGEHKQFISCTVSKRANTLIYNVFRRLLFLFFFFINRKGEYNLLGSD